MGKKRKLGQPEAAQPQLLQPKKQKQMPIVIFVDGAGKHLESSKQVGLIQANLLPNPKVELKPSELIPNAAAELSSNPLPTIEAKPAEPTLKKKKKTWQKRSKNSVTTCVDNTVNVEAKINEEEDELLRIPGLTVTTGVDVENNVEAKVNEEGEALTKTGLTETVGDVKNKRIRKRKRKEKKETETESTIVDELLPNPVPNVEAEPEDKEKKRMRRMRQKERRKERRKEMEKQHVVQLFQLLNLPMPGITLTEMDTESTQKKVAAKEVEIKYVEVSVLFSIGESCIDFFFFLSGFLIHLLFCLLVT